MIERGTGRPAGHLAALGLILLAGLGAWAGAIGGAPAFASGESSGEDSGSPSGAQSSPTSTSNCPSPNPPNQLTLVAGTPQTTTLDTAFAGGLQVALANSDGCAVTGAAGVAVTFSAPTGGASGRFSTTNSDTATVGADASGMVAAPTFTANGTAGSYTVTASSPYGSVSFALTNTAAGLPARLTAIPLNRRSTRVGSRFPQPLQVRVLDAGGNPVAGVAVTFVLGSATTGGCDATASAGAASGAGASADFAGDVTQTTAISGTHGIATSPAFTATSVAGSFAATASVSSGGASEGASASKNGDANVAPVGFSLVNLAGKPAKLAPGVGSTQSTPAGSAFAIRLAVTVTDADSNPVRGALVTFSAPTAGASGRFTLHPRDGHHHRAHVSYSRLAQVKTGACGIAVAPPFTASAQPGGYVVLAGAEPARPAAFALVNEAPGQAL
jgi:protocatechuate 3,4-dioxygenase beta subunit